MNSNVFTANSMNGSASGNVSFYSDSRTINGLGSMPQSNSLLASSNALVGSNAPISIVPIGNGGLSIPIVPSGPSVAPVVAPTPSNSSGSNQGVPIGPESITNTISNLSDVINANSKNSIPIPNLEKLPSNSNATNPTNALNPKNDTNATNATNPANATNATNSTNPTNATTPTNGSSNSNTLPAPTPNPPAVSTPIVPIAPVAPIATPTPVSIPSQIAPPASNILEPSNSNRMYPQQQMNQKDCSAPTNIALQVFTFFTTVLFFILFISMMYFIYKNNFYKQMGWIAMFAIVGSAIGIYLIYMISYRVRLLMKQDCSIEQFDKKEIEKENAEAIAVLAGNVILPIMAFTIPFLFKNALGDLDIDPSSLSLSLGKSGQNMKLALFIFGMLYFFMQTTCSILYFVKDM